MTTRLLTRVALLGALLLALSPLGPTTGAASASCAGPQLDLERGATIGPFVEVTGSAFVDSCQDVQYCSGACMNRCTAAGPEPRPLTGVDLTLRQGGRSWVLDEADADADGAITFSATLPDGVRPGRAVLTAGRESRTVVRLEP